MSKTYIEFAYSGYTPNFIVFLNATAITPYKIVVLAVFCVYGNLVVFESAMRLPLDSLSGCGQVQRCFTTLLNLFA